MVPGVPGLRKQEQHCAVPGVSQAEQRRAAALRVLGVLGHAGQQRRARQPPELGGGQLLPGGRELPAHVAPADPALGYGPGVPAQGTAKPP